MHFSHFPFKLLNFFYSKPRNNRDFWIAFKFAIASLIALIILYIGLFILLLFILFSFTTVSPMLKNAEF